MSTEPNPAQPNYLDTKEAARRMRTSVDHVRQLCNDGTLIGAVRAYEPNGPWRIPAASVAAWIAAQAEAGGEETQAQPERGAATAGQQEQAASANLPGTRFWQKVVAVGAIITILAGIASILNDSLGLATTPLPESLQTIWPSSRPFAAAEEGEMLVIVADFLDPTGVDSALFTQNLVRELRETLAEHEQVRIEYLEEAIPAAGGSEQAQALAQERNVQADIVIWGNYTADPEQQVHIHFDIVQEPETYLETGFYERQGAGQIVQPSMFDFQIEMGTYLGQMVAFTAGLVLFEDRLHIDAQPFFDTAVTAINAPLAEEFAPAIHFYRGTNLLYLGRALEAKVNLLALEPIVQIAIAAPSTIDSDNDLVWSMLNNIGSVYNALGDKEEALASYNEALPIFREMGNRSGEAVTLNNIGSVYDTLGDKEEALAFYNEALPIRREVGDRSGEAVTLSNIGLVYSALGDKEKALAFYNEALPIFREVGDWGRAMTTLNNIGGVYNDLGDKEEALAFFNEALPIRREMGDRNGEATTLNNIGGVYSALGDKEKALAFYNEALPIRREVGDRNGEATTLNNIGGVYFALGDKEEALAFYNEVLPIKREVGDRNGEATTLNNIGGVYFALEDYGQAEAYLEQAASLYEAVGDRWGEHLVRQNRSYLLFVQGDHEAAEAEILQTIKLAEQLGHPSLATNKEILQQIREKMAEQSE